MKNAIVTGASRGLGRAIAERLAGDGYLVWISARNEEELHAVKSEIEAATGSEVSIDAVDFSSKSEVERYAQKLSTEVKEVDVLVNNAGIYIPDHLLGETSELKIQMAVNFEAPYLITQALIPGMVSRGAGSIFNICSIVNNKPRIDAASYTISKHAFYGYHRLLHDTLREKGIKVTALLPASINTSSWDGIDAPLDEFIQPEDLADMISNVLKMSRGTVPSEIEVNCINPNF